MSDIIKAAGVILVGRKLLFARSTGKSIYLAPGGKPEGDETVLQALVRELSEELNITVTPDDVEFFKRYEAPAAGQPGRMVEMHVFMVKHWDGQIRPGAEIAELRWLTADVPEDVEVGSIFGHQLLPDLQAMGLMD